MEFFSETKNADRGMNKMESLYTAQGNETSPATLAINIVISHKTKTGSIVWLSYITPGNLPDGVWAIISQVHLSINVYHGTIDNS